MKLTEKDLHKFMNVRPQSKPIDKWFGMVCDDTVTNEFFHIDWLSTADDDEDNIIMHAIEIYDRETGKCDPVDCIFTSDSQDTYFLTDTLDGLVSEVCKYIDYVKSQRAKPMAMFKELSQITLDEGFSDCFPDNEFEEEYNKNASVRYTANSLYSIFCHIIKGDTLMGKVQELEAAKRAISDLKSGTIHISSDGKTIALQLNNIASAYFNHTGRESSCVIRTTDSKEYIQYYSVAPELYLPLTFLFS